jgi:hypothetical protein
MFSVASNIIHNDFNNSSHQLHDFIIRKPDVSQHQVGATAALFWLGCIYGCNEDSK